MEYLTEKEVAKKLRTNNRRVANWRRAGLIKGVKLSRQYVYREKDVDDFFSKFLGKDLSADHYLNLKK